MEHRTLAEFASGLQHRVLSDLRGAQPAVVVNYDATTQTAELSFPQPRPALGDDDEPRWARQPNVEGARVLFSATATAGLTYPLAPGDRGVFVPWEQSADEYTASDAPPRRVRAADKFTLGCGGVFFPSPVVDAVSAPASAGVTTLSGPFVHLADAAAAELVARADRVEAQLATLAGRVFYLESWAAQLVTAFATWYPVILGAATLLGIVPPPLPHPAFYSAQLVPGVPVAPATPAQALAGSDVAPASYAGTGPVGADRVRCV